MLILIKQLKKGEYFIMQSSKRVKLFVFPVILILVIAITLGIFACFSLAGCKTTTTETTAAVTAAETTASETQSNDSTDQKGENSIVKQQDFNNPIIEQRADPWVYKHTDGFYYFTASVPEYDRIILRRAKTIQSLGTAEEAVIWKKHASGEMSIHVWAPEIHYIDGKWYIYFAAGGLGGDKWGIRPYVLECVDENPITGTWIEKGMMQKVLEDKLSFTDFSLDATTFEHNGVRYLVWAQKTSERNNPSNLYIAEMENPWTIKGEPVMISKPELPWEIIGFWVNEGAAVIKRNGRIFMSYSASATDSNYCMGLLTASDTADLLDPNSWSKSPEPVFKTSEENSQYGPGHGSFTVSEDGTKDILIYHARNYKDIVGDPLYDPNRNTRAQVLNWNDDGTPKFGIPVAD
jgi:beta-galactosidase